MAAAEIAFDLTGATVRQIAWPPRGFRLVLSGQTAEGCSVDGAQVTFEAVVNQFPLRMFLTEKRILRKRVMRHKDGRSVSFVDNSCKALPLKLPAKLTCLRLSKVDHPTYGDRAFTDFHGEPPEPGARQKLYLFALAEKRFKGRKPFPIVCSRVAFHVCNESNQIDTPKK